MTPSHTHAHSHVHACILTPSHLPTLDPSSPKTVHSAPLALMQLATRGGRLWQRFGRRRPAAGHPNHCSVTCAVLLFFACFCIGRHGLSSDFFLGCMQPDRCRCWWLVGTRSVLRCSNFLGSFQRLQCSDGNDEWSAAEITTFYLIRIVKTSENLTALDITPVLSSVI